MSGVLSNPDEFSTSPISPFELLPEEELCGIPSSGIFPELEREEEQTVSDGNTSTTTESSNNGSNFSLSELPSNIKQGLKEIQESIPSSMKKCAPGLFDNLDKLFGEPSTQVVGKLEAKMSLDEISLLKDPGISNTFGTAGLVGNVGLSSPALDAVNSCLKTMGVNIPTSITSSMSSSTKSATKLLSKLGSLEKALKTAIISGDSSKLDTMLREDTELQVAFQNISTDTMDRYAVIADKNGTGGSLTNSVELVGRENLSLTARQAIPPPATADTINDFMEREEELLLPYAIPEEETLSIDDTGIVTNDDDF